ncbi:AAA family ATPase [Rossellomorea marisflavi]|uniref:AAA family ATPase n=1 Tax=Rossellomorea marisflavi TaxID=189381 RepID=UPI00207A0981|nr:AAA family ATPase [Rossellomorea marisflavi]USK92869.1 ATP-binding protein [Rossellomorea marisflavi]
MEFVYYWIDNFRGVIKDQGYNFGDQLLFEYDYNNKELIIKVNKLYVKDFFNLNGNHKIKNLTAVVGQNGVGKSTFIDALKGLLIDGGILATSKNGQLSIGYYKRILVLKYKDEYNIFYHTDLINHNNDGVPSIKFDSDKIKNEYIINPIPYGNGENVVQVNNKIHRVKGTEILSNTSCIYFSQAFDSNFYYDTTMEDRKYFDISSKGLLAEIEKKFEPSQTFSSSEPNHRIQRDTRFNNGLIKEFIISENKKKLKMLSDEESRKIIRKHSFFPTKIYLFLDYIIYKQEKTNFLEIDQTHLLRVEKNTQPLNKIEKYIYDYIETNFIDPDNMDNLNLLRQTYLRRVLDSYFEDVDRFLFFKKRKDLLRNTLENLNEKVLENKNLVQLLGLFYENTIHILSTTPENYKLDKGFNRMQFDNLTRSYINFIKFLEKEVLTSSSPAKKSIYGQMEFIKTDRNIQSIGFKDFCLLEIQLDKQGIELLELIISHYEALDTSTNFLKFQWEGISTGEDTLLSIYSRFYSLREMNLGENIIILLDEIEHSLHPEWQRNLLKNLLEYLTYVFSECGSIQILLASNIPFLIADVPTQNIVYLEKDGTENPREKSQENIKISNKPGLITQTFAANIHTLLINNFFMKSTIGAFSEKKIDEVIRILKNGEIDKYSYTKIDVWRIIQNIGEPVIHNKLKSMFIEKFGLPNSEEKITDIINKFIQQEDYSREKVDNLLQIIIKNSYEEM